MTSSGEIRVVAAEIQRDGTYLLTQRRLDARLGGLWEFPGGRVREGETDAAALQRCLVDRLGVAANIASEPQMEVFHAYEGYCVRLITYSVELVEEPRAVRVAAVRWLAPHEMAELEFPGADQQSVDALLEDD